MELPGHLGHWHVHAAIDRANAQFPYNFMCQSQLWTSLSRANTNIHRIQKVAA